MLPYVVPHFRSGTLPVLLVLVFLAGLVPGTAFGQKKSVTDGEIQAALKRAIASLKPKVNASDDGHSALITMALLKAGVKPDSAEIQVGLERILKRISSHEYKPGMHWVYEAGVSLMALANADAVKYKPQIATIAKFLIEVQQPGGFWDYPSPGFGDTSISQYAILALWEAHRAGVHVPKKVWDKAAGWHISHQASDGGFYYHPAADVGQGMGMVKPSHSMTVAGTASLYVTRLHLYPDARDTEAPAPVGSRSGRKRGKKYGILEPADHVRNDAAPLARAAEVDDASYKRVTRLSAIDAAISRGKSWLADRFTVEPRETWDIYYLYGLERLSALANAQEYGGHDWYHEGAAHLCATQDTSGGWRDACGADPATALGVLFLTKATAKMLDRKERRPPERRYGGGILIGGRGLPENLDSLEVDQNGIRVRKLKGPVDELLAELENAQSQKIESAQEALVETIATQDPEALVGQTERLLKLVGDKRPEVRRTVFWALGRTDDLRVVPTLIRGLGDANLDCMVEARNALRFISKKIDVHEPPDEPTDAQRQTAIALWKKWYRGVRPYDERDDLGEAPVK
ncbi:MAG TPA: HEAT repeat domain-containing protein [Planctomycetaceae bacterium]